MVKAAVTFSLPLTVTVQVRPELESQPVQPAKVDPVVALAVRVTVVPKVNEPLQSVPHEMPAGLEVTVPAPVPVRLTPTVKPSGSKAADTFSAPLTVTVQ